jgi:glycerophosphoryl diester phosphodiesterase
MDLPSGSADPGVQVGPRPYYLVDQMRPGPLKDRLMACADGPIRRTRFSMGHRGGASLQFPEHTRESFRAGARMGAGLLECDVTFTKDGALVCRHDQCDLHSTTNILLTPLASHCSIPFTAAEFDSAGRRTKPASALCCTSDLDLREFQSLKGRMDASNPNARTPREFLAEPEPWRTDLYSAGGTLLTHGESITLISRLGADFAPELKGPNRDARIQIEDVFGTRERYAQAMIDEYRESGISADRVFPQSFDVQDVQYWIRNAPDFGRRAVLLEGAFAPEQIPTADELRERSASGIRIVAAPLWMLLDVDPSGEIVPSKYAREARAAGLDLIAWTLERSGRIVEEVLPTRGTATPSFYYQSTLEALENDGDLMTVLDVLSREVGVLGVFSDWSGTVSYHASCMGLE